MKFGNDKIKKNVAIDLKITTHPSVLSRLLKTRGVLESLASDIDLMASRTEIIKITWNRYLVKLSYRYGRKMYTGI